MAVPSLLVKENVTGASLLPTVVTSAGGRSKDVVGSVALTTDHACVVIGASTRAFGSITLASNVCSPYASPVKDSGEAQPDHGPASRRHWYAVAPGALNSKLAERLSVVAAGALVRTTSPGMVPIDHSNSAGVRSRLPWVSTARTSSTCSP